MNPRFLLRSFHNFSVEVVSHTTWRLSLRGGRPLFERFMFVNSEGKPPNIRRVQTVNSKRASRKHLQQPVSADCNDMYSPMIEHNRGIRIICTTENGAGTVLARDAFWLSVVL